ncbi:hypothetical protein ACLIMP_22645 [Novosphingobium aerophilum]|uniref:hypothetical protein n=1 Tax=Novosphingobium aerophilum TaxID=2839843 RepID=UPI00163D9EFB
MKIVIGAALAAALGSSAAYAQSHNPAVKDPTVATTRNAAKGHNSFTEDQARGRIAKAGYTNIGTLTQNENGVWQGKAMRHGKPVTVALDYKGNVTVH